MVLGRIKKVREFAKECKEIDIEFNLIIALISKNYRKKKRGEYYLEYYKKRGYF